MFETFKADLNAALENDPAAKNKAEIIFTYGGFRALQCYRRAHWFYTHKMSFIAFMITAHARKCYGVEIHPAAKIGKGVFIDHGVGLIIGETTEIGDNVKIYQGVTLGALSTRQGQQLRGVKRHPTLGDNVTIYANTTVLGGETVIGDNATVAGNTFLVNSVPSDMKVSMRAPELEYRSDSKK